jgi:hypothetical protein
MSMLSTVVVVDAYEKVKAEVDANQYVHYKVPGDSGNTLCGMKAAGPTEADVSCYECHVFSRGDF